MNELTRIRIEHSRQLLADTTFDLRWARRLANPEQEHTLLYQDIGSLRAMLEIMVEDNGPGVPQDMLPILFDPFVTTKANGSGLGLALVAKIIGDHGGVIDSDSRPGRTRFRILLPVASGAFANPAEEANSR